MFKLLLFLLAQILLFSAKNYEYTPEVGTVTKPVQVTYDLSKGDKIILNFSQLSSAGYIWEVYKQPTNIIVTKQTVVDTSGLTGAAEKVNFVLECQYQCDRNDFVSFIYLRPWLMQHFLEGGVERYKANDGGFEPRLVEVNVKLDDNHKFLGQFYFDF